MDLLTDVRMDFIGVEFSRKSFLSISKILKSRRLRSRSKMISISEWRMLLILIFYKISDFINNK